MDDPNLKKIEKNEEVAGKAAEIAESAIRRFERSQPKTEVSNFNESGLLTDQQLADYLGKILPASHFEKCPSIQHDPTDLEFSEDPSCLAYFNRESHAIKIGPAERFDTAQPETADGILGTTVHEVGHNVHENILGNNPGLAAQWGQIHSQSGGNEFVSNYAREGGVYEDFAESYRAYVHEPEILKFRSPAKYEFMRSNVFGGREYNPR
jgi:hypothetical protein